jgi:hypothetical protein
MVASITPHRDEVGLGDGLMLIDGRWVAAASEESPSVVFADADAGNAAAVTRAQ